MVAGSEGLQIAIEDMFGEEDRIAVRWTMRGTHTGELLGYSATQKKLDGSAMWIFRIEDGQVAERWYETDWSALRATLED